VEINLLDDGARFEDAVRNAIGIRPRRTEKQNPPLVSVT
jgi:hypothetical protein